jgi:protein-S-isoprenylcysteine O-methyltransferase Ste14
LTGFLVQWPTLLTLAMYPVLIWMYVRLARAEERETRASFGARFDAYAARVPAFLPNLTQTHDATQ